MFFCLIHMADCMWSMHFEFIIFITWVWTTVGDQIKRELECVFIIEHLLRGDFSLFSEHSNVLHTTHRIKPPSLYTSHQQLSTCPIHTHTHTHPHTHTHTHTPIAWSICKDCFDSIKSLMRFFKSKDLFLKCPVAPLKREARNFQFRSSLLLMNRFSSIHQYSAIWCSRAIIAHVTHGMAMSVAYILPLEITVIWYLLLEVHVKQQKDCEWWVLPSNDLASNLVWLGVWCQERYCHLIAKSK